MSLKSLPTKWPFISKVLFTDIDDTLTWEGQLPLETFKALYDLREAGIKVVPVTGGSAGWADCLIRTWPIDTIITENGSMWLIKDQKNKVNRHYFMPEKDQEDNLQKLRMLKSEFQKHFPSIPDTADQDFRITDVAFDIGQQVTIDRKLAQQAADWWMAKGASARCSSIHINVWIGQYNKAIAALRWLSEHSNYEIEDCVFIGDSPNDEAMFQHFENTVGVANIAPYLNHLDKKPSFITQRKGGYGFVELANSLLHAS